MILALLECANILSDLAQSSAKAIDCLHVLEDDLLDLANSPRHLPQSTLHMFTFVSLAAFVICLVASSAGSNLSVMC